MRLLAGHGPNEETEPAVHWYFLHVGMLSYYYKPEITNVKKSGRYKPMVSFKAHTCETATPEKFEMKTSLKPSKACLARNCHAAREPEPSC